MQELTRQQNVIVKLLAEGYNNAEIADELKISRSTAKNHVSDIINRLNLRDKQEVVVYYYKDRIKELEEENRKLKGESEIGTQRTI